MNEDLRSTLKAVLQEELNPLRNELNGLKNEVNGLKNEVTQVKQEQQKTNERLTNLESKLHIVYEQTGKLTEYHTETMSKLEHLATKEDLEYYDKKISQHEREIFKIKNKA